LTDIPSALERARLQVAVVSEAAEKVSRMGGRKWPVVVLALRSGMGSRSVAASVSDSER